MQQSIFFSIQNSCTYVLPLKTLDMEEWESDSCFSVEEKDSGLNLADFKRDLLQAHNHFRHLHDSPALIILPELNESAQLWADNLATKTYLQYADLNNIGENILKVDLAKEPLNGKTICRNWYREIKHYSFSEPGWKKGAFHFSQMIWKNTTHMGIGTARIPDSSSMFIVVRYFPAGNSNMPGEFYRNVLPRISVFPSDSTSSWCPEDAVIRQSSCRKLRSLASLSIASEEAFF